jgi:hypothetical protein
MVDASPSHVAPSTVGAVPVDRRLGIDLDILRAALGAYLCQLRALWSVAEGGDGSASEVNRLVGAVGFSPRPDRDGPVVASARHAIQAERSGPLARVVTSLGLELGQELMVAAAWWSETDPQFAVTLGCAHDDGTRRFASAALLRLVLRPYGIEVPPAVDDTGPVVRLGLLQAGAGASFPLRLTPTAFQVLAGMPVRALAGAGSLVVSDRLDPFASLLARHLATPSARPVMLRGVKPADGAQLAVTAARRAALIPVSEDRPVAELRLLARTAGAVAVIGGSGEAVEWDADDGPLIIIAPETRADEAATDGPAETADHDLRVVGSNVHVVDVPPSALVERATQWAAALLGAGMERPEADDLGTALGGRFGFGDSGIDSIVADAVTSATWAEKRLDADAVWAAARRRPSRVLDRLASLVTPVFTLDDMVLPDDTRAQLDELLDHVALQHVVLDRGGFRRRLPRGQGVAALLAGPPGTGKTMACEALARALHQDLYVIDLSAVVSKYIGETEKHLAAAFSEAERAGAVLFFDEADSLFGRRTEVKDAHDRYANLEVNFLLQRVETFTGLVLLASNRRSAVDDAFLRRLRFVITFAMPDASGRRRLWQRAFPPETEVAGLDFDRLATAELSGATIQGAALAAAFLAAKAGTPVTEAHVLAALRRQYEKLGKSWAGLPGPAASRTGEGGQ